ncbi:TetR/AcrR family transcriptional regulator, partial [Streptococcus anginosus]
MKRNTAGLKERLIQTGVEEIKKHGSEQLSLRTIAKSCGVTHGTPYRHF